MSDERIDEAQKDVEMARFMLIGAALEGDDDVLAKYARMLREAIVALDDCVGSGASSTSRRSAHEQHIHNCERALIGAALERESDAVLGINAKRLREAYADQQEALGA